MTPERLIFAACLLALCWVFPRPPVLIFSVAAMIGLVFSALPDAAADVESEGRSKILAKIAGIALLDVLAAYGCAWGIPLLPPLVLFTILAEFVAVFVFGVAPAVLVAVLVTVLFVDRPPAPARNRVEGGRP